MAWIARAGSEKGKPRKSMLWFPRQSCNTMVALRYGQAAMWRNWEETGIHEDMVSRYLTGESRLALTWVLDISTGGKMQGPMAREIPKTWSFRELSWREANTYAELLLESSLYHEQACIVCYILREPAATSTNEWMACATSKNKYQSYRTILHCHWDDTSEILIQMYHTKVIMNSVGQEFLIQHSSADDSWDNYSKHKKGHRKIKVCFSLKNTLYVHSSTYCTNCTGGLLAWR